MHKKDNAKEVVNTSLLNPEKTFWQKLLQQKQLFWMSVPLVLYIVLFKFYPLWGWTMAFQDYKPSLSFSEEPWVGLKWFGVLIKDKQFLLALRNTVCMSLISTVLGYISAIIIALFLNEVKHVGVKRIVQTVSYLPHFLSWVIVTGLVSSILSVEDGTLNNVLMALGVIKSPIMWLSVPKYF
jgi:putative aldouronate transport system permease protein